MLGKTVTTLSAIRQLRWDIDRVLVIAPKRPAIDTWPEELKKWEHLSDLDYAVAVGSAAQLAHLFHGKYLVIINKGPTKMEGKADLVFHESIGEVLTGLYGE